MSNRQAALKSGNKTYHGRPCKNCRATIKRTRQGDCIYCHKTRRYEINPKEFKNLLKMQKRRCAICNVPDKNKPLCIDHDHSTGKVRGLLCRECNLGIGKLHDDTVTVENALNYLKKHQ